MWKEETNKPDSFIWICHGRLLKSGSQSESIGIDYSWNRTGANGDLGGCKKKKN